ncbi:CRISPR system precrRNA processing endoribonuclease RAMP protein Cas6 [Rhodoferax antarcticus]|uniref:CRISPR system precrRNA processing endoribonuclease RAMP protein Cas6 n=1 Tax=Rhodoferax antarcticus TaxID=81479 RepID=UPI00222474AD|nr:CRISPR system precrRNA processing endoribonuclease RAMP protein Cas6 [Rhodoferax antarcticus]MCW2313129.1 hypothetical protein [Rhodoferax antarcticus]
MFTRPHPIARYRFTSIVQQPLQLPDFAGSLLRGQFGAALRSVACMTRAPACPGCPLIQTCPYSRIFEAPPPPKGQHTLQDFSQIPKPYIIEPPTPGARLLAAGEPLVFNLVLVGHAIDQLALVVFALQRMLAQGLTRQRVPADLVQVDWLATEADSAQTIWTASQPTLAAHAASLNHLNSKSIATSAVSTGATGQNDVKIALNIQTPLRLQHQGKPLGVGQLTPRALVAAIARRTALLMEFHTGQSGWGEAARAITHLSETLSDTQDLHWFDWTRYSSRQQQEMTLGGVLGTWTLHGSAEALAQIEPWLWLGQWLHVGKNATMGQGCYTLNS